MRSGAAIMLALVVGAAGHPCDAQGRARRPAPSATPSVQAGGRVVRIGPRDTDTVPAAGTRVLLHRVGRDTQGPVDSVLSDVRGRFSLRFRADTSALYLLSARYAGIEYFSPPVHLNPALPDTAIALVVSDTSSRAPVSLIARHLVVPSAAEDGSRAVLDLLVIGNAGRLTRVPRDSLSPSFTAPLPPAALGFEPGEGDLSVAAIEQRGDEVAVLAPISPGDKQITLQYVLRGGGRGFSLAFPDSVGALNVLAEERDLRVTGAGITRADSQVVQGKLFYRWTGRVPAGGRIRIVFPGGGIRPAWLLPALVSVLAIGLTCAAWNLLRGPERSLAGLPLDAPPTAMLDELAALDAQYRGREGELSPERWSRYREMRAALKRRLEGALAERGGRR